ncbi:hypothetical protein HK096_007451, partial [Nowakowskiella sp. JEL0078]
LLNNQNLPSNFTSTTSSSLLDPSLTSEIQSNNPYHLSQSVLFPKDSNLNFTESLASPIFPAKSDKIAQSTIYSQSNYHLGMPPDSRFDSFPSPLSAYTVSPALTSFSNVSHCDPHEEPLFPPALSTDASPLITPHDGGQLLFDRLDLEGTGWGTRGSTSFSPSLDFASLDIDPKKTYDNLFDDVGSVTEFGGGTPVAIHTHKYSTASDDFYDDSDSEGSVVKIKTEPYDIYDAPLFNFKYEDDDEDMRYPQYGMKGIPSVEPSYASTMFSEDHKEFGQKCLPNVKMEPQSPPYINTLTMEALRSPSFEPEEPQDIFPTEDTDFDGDFEMFDDDDDESVYKSSSASEDDDFTTRPQNSHIKRRGRKAITNPILHTNKISKRSGEFVCPSCSRSFNRRFNLATHMQTHDAHRARPFACPNCASTFVRQHDLTRHASVHAATKPHKCAGCGTAFSRRDAMLRHVMQRSKCAKAAERAEKEAVEKLKDGDGDLELSAAAAGLSRGRGRRRKGVGMSIQKTEIQLLHEDPEAKKVIEEAFRMQRELMLKKRS